MSVLNVYLCSYQGAVGGASEAEDSSDSDSDSDTAEVGQIFFPLTLLIVSREASLQGK